MDAREYYTGIANEMIGRLHRVERFISHRPSIGTCHEEILRGTLEQMMSDRFKIRTGFAYNPGGSVSKQGDLLIVDESDPSPYLFRQGNFVVVHPRAIAMVIEVKTTLRKRDFVDAMENLYSFQKVQWGCCLKGAKKFQGFIFSFDSQPFRSKTLHGWYKALEIPHDPRYYPNMVMSLRQGLMMFVPGSPEGHRPVFEQGDVLKISALSLFLATIQKHLEMRADLASNPYSTSFIEGASVGHVVFQFGVGAVQAGPPEGLGPTSRSAIGNGNPP